MFTRLCAPIASFVFPFALVVVAVSNVQPAAADEASSYQRILEEWSQKIPDLEKSDSGETAKEIALIRSWIGQAQAFIASEDFEKIDPILARIEVMAAFVPVRQARAKIEAEVKNSQQLLDQLNQSIAQAKAKAEALLKEVNKAEGIQ